MAEQLGKFLTELPELTSPSDSNLMYVVDGDTSKKATLGNLKKIVGGDVTGAGSGAIVSFSDGADNIPLKSFIAQINPTQDLHGYDKPWAGGAGKNKLDLTTIYPYKREMGVTITVNSDGTFTFNGTTTDTSQISHKLPLEVAKTFAGMILNGNVANSGINCILELDGSPYTVYGNDNGSGATISNDIANINKDVNLIYRVQSGVTLNNVVIKPMIRLATEIDPSWQPYENICPISGHTSVTVTISDGETSTTKTTALGQTVYGGQLNVLTGGLTVDRAIVDLGSFNWISESTTLSGLARVGVEETRPLGALYNQTPICSSYEGVAPKGYSAFNNGEISFSNNEANPMIRVRNQNFASMTDAQIKSAMNGVTLCYELATPITVQLTPQEVNSLLGQNYIEADSGDVDLVYVRNLNIVINDLINRVTALENE